MGDIRVVIVDGQHLVRAGFSLILQAQPDIRVLGEGGAAETAISFVKLLQPDVLLLAKSLEGADVFKTVACIRELEVKQPRILLLVGSREGDLTETALNAGADGVLGKYATPEQIVAQVRRAAVLPR